MLAAACAPKPGETVAPPVAEAVSEPEAASTEPAEPAAAPPPAKKNRDRDPAEERRKMALSRQQSAQAAAALRSGSLPQSIELAREALRIHEQNVEAMLVMAEAYLKQDKHELTQTVTSSALAVDPKLLTPTETSRIHNLKGFAYLAADKQNLATQSFRKAAEVDARNATAWNNLGAQYLRTGNFKTAGDCFTYATKLDPAFYKAHLNLGSARRALGDVVNAERSYQTALKLRPEYREAYFSLGVLYLDASEFPGTDTATRLTRALNNFSKYRELAIASGTGGGDRPGDDVARVKSGSKAPKPRAPTAGKERVSVAQADLYIDLAKKGLEREKKREERAQKRGQDGTAEPGKTTAGKPGEPSAPVTPAEPGKPGVPSPAKPGAPATPATSAPGEATPPHPAPRPRHPPASQANRARHPS
jgi:tetratricopeptide (TPR) repeat protein